MATLSPRPARVALVDQARGVALIAMFSYHAAWFASDAGLVQLDFAAPGWRAYQQLIAGSFLALVGVSVSLAHQQGVLWRRFAGRTARVAGCALVVTAASFVLDPARVVTFGILHCITLSSVIAWSLRRAGVWSALPGAGLMLVAGLDDARFDAPWLRWTGVGTLRTPTFDFQPVAPWCGVVLLGLAAACVPRLRVTERQVPAPGVARSPIPAVGSTAESAVRPARAGPGVALAWLGRHSLYAYMAHVPLLGGMMMTVRWLFA